MTAYEKISSLKNAIFQLYENEGRSINYISKLLEVNRNVLSQAIKEWDFHQHNQEKRKIQEFLAQHKDFIIARIKDGWKQKAIAQACKVGDVFYHNVIEYDVDIQNTMKNCTFKDKEYLPIEDEIWKPILGYTKYEVSNYGRIRNKKGLIKTEINSACGYVYCYLYKGGKHKGYRVHRLVANAFCPGRTPEKDEVNHKDGNILNCKASNLEWCTHAENMDHSINVLGKKSIGGKPLSFIILYKDKYRFKTIMAFANFIGKSYTQAKRYIDENPEQHDIKKIPKK